MTRARFEALIDEATRDVATAVALATGKPLSRDAANAIREALKPALRRARQLGVNYPGYVDGGESDPDGIAEWTESDTSPGNARGKRQSDRTKKP